MRGVGFVAFALVAVFLFAATGVQAKATVTNYTLCGPQPTVDLTNAKQWIDDEGVLHIRDAPYTWASETGISTTVTGVEGYNVDTATGAGDFFGTMTAVNELGTFEGRLSGTFLPGPETAFVGSLNLHGDAGFLTGTFDFPSDACAGNGGMVAYLTILSPHA